MSLHSDNNDKKPHNEIRNFFNRPIYLLPLKIPLVVIGTIFYIMYCAVKLTIEQLVNMLVTIVIYVSHLAENIGFRLILIIKNFPMYFWHISTKFYWNIMQTVKFFVYNIILPVISNMNKWILGKLLWFCIWCYQQVIIPTVRFCYLSIILPIPTWINELSIALRSTLSFLFHRFRSAFIWTCQTILLWIFTFIYVLLLFFNDIVKIGSSIYPHVSICVVCTIGSFGDACVFFYQCILLWFSQQVLKIGSYIYAELLIPLYRWVKSIIPKLYHYLRKSISQVSAFMVHIISSYSYKCMSLYAYVLLSFTQKVLKIGSYIYTELLIPLYRWIKSIIPKLYHYLRKSISQVSAFMVHIIPFYYYKCVSLYGYVLLSFTQKILKIGSYVYTELLIPLYRCVKGTMPIIYYYLRKLFLHVSTCMVYTIGSFDDACMFFYRYILLPFIQKVLKIGSYIYIGCLTPLYRWVKGIIPIIYYYLRKLLLHVSTCIVYITGYFYDACALFYRNTLLLFNQKVLKIGWYIYTGILTLTPLYRWIKGMIPKVYYCLGKIISQVGTFVVHILPSYCYNHAFRYVYILLHFCQTSFTICSLIYGEMFKPAIRLVVYNVRMIYYQLYQYVFQPIGYILYSMKQFYNIHFLQALRSTISTLLPTILKISREIFIIVQSSLNAAAIVLTILAKAIRSLFRSTTKTKIPIVDKVDYNN
jgi:hypothetical protein